MLEYDRMVRRKCAWCGVEYMARRSDSRYCSEKHRQQAYRWRKALPQHEAEAKLDVERIAPYLDYQDSRDLAASSLRRVRFHISQILKQKGVEKAS